jgi:hypothetical protein
MSNVDKGKDGCTNQKRQIQPECKIKTALRLARHFTCGLIKAWVFRAFHLAYGFVGYLEA